MNRIKKKKEKGLSLSELVVVLGITLVLTAILMPAIAGTDPERAETIMSAAATPEGLQEVPYRSTTRAVINRVDRRDRHRQEDGKQGLTEEPNQATQEIRTKERDGMKKFLTTDIRSRE